MSNSTRPSSSSTSSYDERFVVPLEASRRGAHRARVSPVMAVLPVAAVVGIVIGAIALVYLFLGGMGGGDTATTAAAPSASPTAAASTSAGAAAASGSPSASGLASDGTVDRLLPVAVYNGTQPTVSGLARKASTRLSTAGWKLGKIDTWNGTPVTETTVFFGSETQRATAMAVAKSLGRGVARLSAANAGAGITVVVGNDYPGAGAARPTGKVTRPTKSAAGGVATHSPTRATKATNKATTRAAATTPSPTTDPATTTTDPANS